MLVPKIKRHLGMSLISVMTMSAAALSGIALVSTQLLPQLQSQSQSSEMATNLNLFISSFMDYTVHGIKDRWCMTTNWMQDLNSCEVAKDAIIHPRNLERLLWKLQTAKDIVKLPGLVGYNPHNILLSEIKHTITKSDFSNFSSEHPLYPIISPISKCLDSINVSIKKDPRVTAQSQGDEINLLIQIEAEINNSLFSPKDCQKIKSPVKSIGSYSFLPRRLLSYGLIKNGDLGGDLPINFHGPVYIGDSFHLPVSSTPPEKATVFYDTVTLGSGIVKTSSGTPYGFSECGDPRHSYNDQYNEFKGFLGGVRLDAKPDLGLSALFAGIQQSSNDIMTLCINHSQFISDLRQTHNTDLFYRNYRTGIDNTSIEIGLSQSPTAIFGNEFKRVIRPLSPSIKSDSEENGIKPYVKDNNTRPFMAIHIRPIKKDYDLSHEKIEYEKDDYLTNKMVIGHNTYSYIDFQELYEDEYDLLDDFLDYIIEDKESPNEDDTLLDSRFDPLFAPGVVRNFYEAYKALYYACRSINPYDFIECKPVYRSLSTTKSCSCEEPTPTPTPSFTPTIVPTATITPTVLATATPYTTATPTATPTALTTATPYTTATPTATPNITPTVIVTPTIALTIAPSPTSTPTPIPRVTPKPCVCDQIRPLYNKYMSTLAEAENLKQQFKAVADDNTFNKIKVPAIEIVSTLKKSTTNQTHNNQVVLKFQYKNWDLLQKSFTMSGIDIRFESFDLGFDREGNDDRNRRPPLKGPNAIHDTIHLSFKETSPKFFLPQSYTTLVELYREDPKIWNPFYLTILKPIISDLAFYENYDICEDTESSNAMTLVDWDVNLTAQTYRAWNIFQDNNPNNLASNITGTQEHNLYFNFDSRKNKDDLIGAYLDSNALYAVKNDCVVAPNRKRIFGYYVCRNFIIQSGRTSNLQIIGTIITNNIIIEEKTHRVDWYSFWVPEALELYQKFGNASGNKTAYCSQQMDYFKDVSTKNDYNRDCSPADFCYGNSADNFTWTTVDPERGFSSESDTKTKSKIQDRFKRFIVIERNRNDEVYIQ